MSEQLLTTDEIELAREMLKLPRLRDRIDPSAVDELVGRFLATISARDERIRQLERLLSDIYRQTEFTEQANRYWRSLLERIAALLGSPQEATE